EHRRRLGDPSRGGADAGQPARPLNRAQAGVHGDRLCGNVNGYYSSARRMTERSTRILLVDDEQSIQTLLSYPLRRDGYEVVQATDGREALERFEERPFDLVVLDVMLPQLDGLEVCRRLRSRSAVPIIMLTAKAEEIDKVVGLEIGADDYITKPF